MMQVLQNLKSGETLIAEVPCPALKAGNVLIATQMSLISAGTERMLLEFGKGNWLQKARQQPEKVQMVLDKVKTDGLVPTLESVRHKLDQPLALGYSNVGVVLEAGAGVTEFSKGDRVVSNGHHAEVVSVPQNLCAKIPENVSDETAAFTVLGAIALQGARLAQPTLGESFVVMGLGMVGLLAVQVLKAQGCRVLGLDFDKAKLKLARRFGAETVDLSNWEDPQKPALAFSRGRGVDGVLIAASTQSDQPIHQAAQMCRKRGRIVLVGQTGLHLSRSDFYEKEITFQVSCSYGPGRHDARYEQDGVDYPIGFVRWTEKRNFEAILDLMADEKIRCDALISHRFPLKQAGEAYQLIASDNPYLGVLLDQRNKDEDNESRLRRQTLRVNGSRKTVGNEKPALGFIGAGNYAQKVLIPAFKNQNAVLRAISSSGGISSAHAANKYEFEWHTTNSARILEDEDIGAIVIATRSDSHCHFVCEGLKRGKRVFVEKPLAIHHSELKKIEEVYRSQQADHKDPFLMVGFNRRFSPHVKKIKSLLEEIREPKSLVMTVNAGYLPPEDWSHDPAVGGGRIVQEGCHFIDLLRFIVGCPVDSIQAIRMGKSASNTIQDDNVTLTMGFTDGSFGTVHYFANGSRAYPKERLELFCGGRVLQLDNFIRLRGYGWPGFKKMKSWRQDKGNGACAAAFVQAVQNGKHDLIPFEELLEVTRLSLDVKKLCEK